MSKSAKDLQHDRFKAIDINSGDWCLVIQQEEYDPNIKYLIPNDESRAIIAIDEQYELAMNTHFYEHEDLTMPDYAVVLHDGMLMHGFQRDIEEEAAEQWENDSLQLGSK